MVNAMAEDRLFWFSNYALAGDASAHATPITARRPKLTGMLLSLPCTMASRIAWDAARVQSLSHSEPPKAHVRSIDAAETPDAGGFCCLGRGPRTLAAGGGGGVVGNPGADGGTLLPSYPAGGFGQRPDPRDRAGGDRKGDGHPGQRTHSRSRWTPDFGRTGRNLAMRRQRPLSQRSGRSLRPPGRREFPRLRADDDRHDGWVPFPHDPAGALSGPYAAHPFRGLRSGFFALYHADVCRRRSAKRARRGADERARSRRPRPADRAVAPRSRARYPRRHLRHRPRLTQREGLRTLRSGDWLFRNSAPPAA